MTRPHSLRYLTTIHGMGRTLRWRASPVVLRTAAFATDSLDRERTELALRDQRIPPWSLLDNVPLGVGMYDRLGELSYSNQRLRDDVDLDRRPSGVPASSRRWHGVRPDTGARLSRRTCATRRAGAVLTRDYRFLETTLLSIPDFVYAFDRQRRRLDLGQQAWRDLAQR